MKAPSVVGRNWWIWMLLAAFSKVLGGRARSVASILFDEVVSGMFRAVRSWLNWSCVSAGLLGCTAGELDQIQACRIMA